MALPKITFSGAVTVGGWILAAGIAWGALTSTTSSSATEHNRRLADLERDMREMRDVNRQTAERLATIETYLVLILKAQGISPGLRRQSEAPTPPWNG